MTAWQKLLAASQLSSGTAWQLLNNPKKGSSGLTVVQSADMEYGRVPEPPKPNRVAADIPRTVLVPNENNNQAVVVVGGTATHVSTNQNQATIPVR